MFPNNKPADTARHWILRRDRRLSQKTTKQSRKWERKIQFSLTSRTSLSQSWTCNSYENLKASTMSSFFLNQSGKKANSLSQHKFHVITSNEHVIINCYRVLLLFWLALRCCARYLRYYISSSVRQIHKFSHSISHSWDTGFYRKKNIQHFFSLSSSLR